MYDTYKIHIIQNHTKIKKIKKKHPKKIVYHIFLVSLFQNGNFPSNILARGVMPIIL